METKEREDLLVKLIEKVDKLITKYKAEYDYGANANAKNITDAVAELEEIKVILTHTLHFFENDYKLYSVKVRQLKRIIESSIIGLQQDINCTSEMRTKLVEVFEEVKDLGLTDRIYTSTLYQINQLLHGGQVYTQSEIDQELAVLFSKIEVVKQLAGPQK